MCSYMVTIPLSCSHLLAWKKP